MRLIRTVYRLFRIVAMVYTVAMALRSSRWFFVALGLWKILYRSRVKSVPVADIAFVDGASPNLYKRVGWRTIIPKRVGSSS